jgi:hypothetical protein
MRGIMYSLIFLVVLLVGCSGSGNFPINPGDTSDSLGGLPIIAATESGDTFNAIGVMGAYEITINTDSLDVSLVSKRTSAIGESYIVSGIGFWTMTPCSDCLKIKSYSLTPEGALAITFVTNHPFPAGNPSEPPTAANRLDLDVFDLAAVIAPVEGATTPVSFSGIGEDIYAGLAFDADGYTRELSNVTSDDAAVPYFLVVDDSDSGTPTYNKFAMGTTGKEFDVKLNIGGGAVPAFDMYLTMGYGASAKKATRLSPKYYNPEFNRKASWKVTVDTPAVWFDDDIVTTNDVVVKVYDWQQGSEVSATVPYSDETDTTKVWAESKVSSVKVEIPGMTSVVPELTAETSGTGTPGDPLVYTFPIANELALTAGEYTSLVKVTDNRAPGSSVLGGEPDTLVDTPDGIALNWYSMPEFAAYQTFTATVVVGCGPITGKIDSPALANYEPITGLADGQPIDITVSATSAGGGNIVQYEADYDYDGVNFVADATNATGIFTGLGPISVPSPCSSNIPMTFDIAFRATDDCPIPNSAIFAVYSGQVDFCAADPVGNVTITINRSTGTFHDPFNNNGPWTLNWSTVPGAAEYAIYYDNIPGDFTSPSWTISSLTDGLELVGITASTSFTVPGLHIIIPSHYLPGNTYIVRARSAAGNPYTESANSQIAFIMTNGFETSATSQITGEGWVGFTYRASTTYYHMMHTDSYRATGGVTWRWGYQNTQYNTVPMSGSTKRTPMGIPNSSRYIDAGINLYQMYVMGISLMTSATQPTSSFLDASTMEWVQPYSSSPYFGYNYAGVVMNTYGLAGVGTGNTSWTLASPNKQRIGADIDATGNSSHPYVGFIEVNTNNVSSNQVYPNVDEIAIMIY